MLVEGVGKPFSRAGVLVHEEERQGRQPLKVRILTKKNNDEKYKQKNKQIYV